MRLSFSLLAIGLVLIGVLGCKKEAVPPPPEHAQHEPRWLKIYRDGVFLDSVNVAGWEVNEDVVVLDHFYYPWQGEDSINYNCYWTLHLLSGETKAVWDPLLALNVNGKLVGVNTYYIDPVEVPKPQDIKSVIVWDCDDCIEATLKQFRNLVSIWVTINSSSTPRKLDVIPKHIRLYVFCYRATNKHLRELSQFSNIRVLNIVDCDRITNCGLRHLRSLGDLRRLRLIGFWDKINWLGKRYLNRLHKLRILNLDDLHT